MTIQNRINIAFVGLLLSVLFFAATAVQVLMSAVHQGLGESKSIRVSVQNACSTTAGGAHFVGCSSIL